MDGECVQVVCVTDIVIRQKGALPSFGAWPPFSRTGNPKWPTLRIERNLAPPLGGRAIEIEDWRNIDEPLRETVGAMNPLIWTALGLASRETAEAARCLGKSRQFFSLISDRRSARPNGGRCQQRQHNNIITTTERERGERDVQWLWTIGRAS